MSPSSLAESTSLPSFDELVAALGRPDASRQTALLDKTNHSRQMVPYTVTAPASRPTTPTDMDRIPFAFHPAMRDAAAVHSREEPHHSRPAFGHTRSSSSLSSASEHYEDRVKAIKSGEGWVHDDAMSPDVLPPWAKPHHTLSPMDAQSPSLVDRNLPPIIKPASTASPKIHPPPMSRSLSQGSQSSLSRGSRPRPPIYIHEYTIRQRSNSTHSPLSTCSPETPTFTHYQPRPIGDSKVFGARRDGEGKRREVTKRSTSVGGGEMRLPTLPQMK